MLGEIIKPIIYIYRKVSDFFNYIFDRVEEFIGIRIRYYLIVWNFRESQTSLDYYEKINMEKYKKVRWLIKYFNKDTDDYILYGTFAFFFFWIFLFTLYVMYYFYKLGHRYNYFRTEAIHSFFFLLMLESGLIIMLGYFTGYTNIFGIDPDFPDMDLKNLRTITENNYDLRVKPRKKGTYIQQRWGGGIIYLDPAEFDERAKQIERNKIPLKDKSWIWSR